MITPAPVVQSDPVAKSRAEERMSISEEETSGQSTEEDDRQQRVQLRITEEFENFAPPQRSASSGK
jgi:hypothetical protein